MVSYSGSPGDIQSTGGMLNEPLTRTTFGWAYARPVATPQTANAKNHGSRVRRGTCSFGQHCFMGDPPWIEVRSKTATSVGRQRETFGIGRSGEIALRS